MDIIGRVPRGTEQEIRIQTGTVWRIDVCDIRWFKEQTTTENGQRVTTMTPTRKGIRVNMDELKHVYNEEENEQGNITESDKEVLGNWDFDS
jgi:hypothetical protein